MRRRTSVHGDPTRGFTLIEILIVVVILGILAAIVVPQFANAADSSKVSNVSTQVDTLQTQIELYYARENQYPAATTMWTDLVAGGYIQSPPRSPFFPDPARTAVDATVGAYSAAAWSYDQATGSIFANVPASVDNETSGLDDPKILYEGTLP